VWAAAGASEVAQRRETTPTSGEAFPLVRPSSVLEFARMSQCVACAPCACSPPRDTSARRFGSPDSASHINCTPSTDSGPPNPPIWVLILVALLGTIGTASIPVLQATLSEDPPKLTRPCIEIASTYVDELRTSPEMRELILPGEDGKSIATADPEARMCGIRPDTLNRIARRPATHPVIRVLSLA
jgi:hypothetical protein